MVYNDVASCTLLDLSNKILIIKKFLSILERILFWVDDGLIELTRSFRAYINEGFERKLCTKLRGGDEIFFGIKSVSSCKSFLFEQVSNSLLHTWTKRLYRELFIFIVWITCNWQRLLRIWNWKIGVDCVRCRHMMRDELASIGMDWGLYNFLFEFYTIREGNELRSLGAGFVMSMDIWWCD
jgi:hypothetical protein